MNETGKAFLRYLIRLGILAAVLGILLTFFFTVRICRGIDMYPGIRDGDLLLIRRTKALHPDDVILYLRNGEEYIGRVAAVPGDTVEVTEDGLRLNGSRIFETLPFETKPQAGPSPPQYPCTLGEGEYFILADLRDQAADSRSFGPVTAEDVIGRELFQMRWRGF